MSDQRLANAWRASQISDCLKKKKKDEIIRFLTERYQERFLEPIRRLKDAPGNEQGYGFAIMALSSLLIETLQCYREGLASSNPRELGGLSQYSPPAEYAIPQAEWPKGGEEVFQRFFATHSAFFPGVDAGEFYRNIRNGLLHQAQTKGGWTIQVEQQKVCDPKAKIIDRNAFAEALEKAFGKYLEDLEQHDWAAPDDIWQKAERKIWWLIRLSL